MRSHRALQSNDFVIRWRLDQLDPGGTPTGLSVLSRDQPGRVGIALAGHLLAAPAVGPAMG